MSSYQTAITSLKNYMGPEVWVHEKCLYHLLPSIEGKSNRDVLTLVIRYLKNGHIGVKKNNIKVSEGMADLADINNNFGIVMDKFGAIEEFSTNNLSSSDNVTARPRWFYLHGNNHSFDVKTQVKIMQAVMGITPINTTLQQHWNGWYSSNAGSTRNISRLIDDICEQFCITKGVIKKMLMYSNKVTFNIPSTRSSSLTSSSPSPPPSLPPPQESTTIVSTSTDILSPQNRSTTTTTTKTPRKKSPVPSLPLTLQLDNLRMLTPTELSKVEEALLHTSSSSPTLSTTLPSSSVIDLY